MDDCPDHAGELEHVVNARHNECNAQLTMSEAAQGARIGDYQVIAELPETMPGLRDLVAEHVLLPRRARLRIATSISTSSAVRLMREVCLLEALRHTGVPRVFECGLLEGRRPWVALEMIDGPTLADAIADRPLLAKETLTLLRDLAEVLHHTHMRGIVHCTLRPEVIVRHATGLVITSWSNAHTHDAARPPELELADMQIYLAPELATDSETIEFDERADIYSLGVIAYEALTLASPTMPLLRRLPALPRGIAQLIERMTATHALIRPSAAEVRAAAIELLDQSRPPELTDDADADGIVEEIIDVEHSQDLAAPELEPPVRESPSQPYTMRPRWTPTHSIYPPPEPPPESTPTRRK